MWRKTRQMRVDGVEQPEVGDVGGAEFGQGLVALAARTGKLAAACDQSLDLPAQDAGKQLVAFDVEKRGNEFGIEPVAARLGALDVGDGNEHRAFEVFAFGQDLQIFAGQGNGLLQSRAILVAQHLQLSIEASA